AVLERRHAHVGIERGVFRRFLLALDEVEHAQGPVDVEVIGERHHFEGARARREGVDFDRHCFLLWGSLGNLRRPHAPSACRLNSPSRPGQPPSTSLRIFSPPSAPRRSNLRCSSSTRVASPSGMNWTSSAYLTVVSGFHWLLMSQVMSSPRGGSHTMMRPTFVSVPSS